MTSSPLHNERREYEKSVLADNHLHPDPLHQLEQWLADALQYPLPDATAMVLATRDPQGRPSTRIVLLKGIENRELVFFTDKRGRKAHHIAHCPFVGVNFYWSALERQVCLQGEVHPIEQARAETYFKTRPHDSQISAWASSQSMAVDSRASLEAQFAAYAQQYPAAVPCPPHWGGFAIRPSYIEFWQGRPARLHDRIAYTLQAEGNWTSARLCP